MTDMLKTMETSAEVVETPSGATVVAIESEILATHVATHAMPSIELDNDDPILAEIFGKGPEDTGDLFRA